MEIKYTVLEDYPEGIVGYDTQDANLAGEFTVFTKFNNLTDFIEAKYEIDGDVIEYSQNFTNYKILPDSEYSPTSGVSRIKLTPEQDVRNLGYESSVMDVTYTFSRNLFNVNNKFEKLFIESISDDRTEVRLVTFNISGSVLLDKINDIRNSLRTDPNFSDFQLLLEDGTRYLAVNIDNQRISDRQSVIVKLYNPLPPSVQTKTQLQVVFEVSNPVRYTVFVEIVQDAPTFPKLSGPNFNSPYLQLDGGTNYLSSVDLLNVNTYSTDALEVISKTSDKSAQLGIDYSDFTNFIHFSSATERLKNFVYKTQIIENYSGSLSILPSVSSSNESRAFYEKGIQNVIRNFDHFERYLYFESGSIPWPKTNSTKPYVLYNSTSSAAITWYNNLLSDCEAYDDRNYNRLMNTLPQYLREDEDNENLVVFVDMLGQHFDNIKVYSDAISKKYNTDNRVTQGLPPNLLEPILENFGVKLYNNEFKSTKDLFKYFVITDDEVDSEIINVTQSVSYVNISEEGYRHELYKRLYHNLPLLLKTKGTERSVKVLMSTFGIPSHIFPVKTYGGTSYKNTPYFGLELPNESGSFNKVRLDSTGSVEGTVLSSQTSIQQRQPDYQMDMHIVEVGPSPSDNINRYILENISSSFNIDEYLGDYRGYNKLSLNKVKEDILGSLDRYDIKDFVRLIRFYDNTFFRMVRDLTPGRDVTDSGIIIKPHILEHNLVKDFSVQITDESSDFQVEIDTAFITGSDGSVFGAKSDYVTSYTDIIQYPDGLTTKPKTQNGYTLVGRHDGEAPRYTGELSGSVIKGAEKELNKDNVFKKPIFFNSFYNITPIIDLATVPPAPTTTTTTSTTTTTTSTTTTTTTTAAPYVSDIDVDFRSDPSSIGDVRVSFIRTPDLSSRTFTLSDTNPSVDESATGTITNAQTGSNALTAQVNKYSSGTVLEIGTGASQPSVTLIVNINGTDVFNQIVNSGPLTVNYTFDHNPGDSITVIGILSTD
jgi:uncharacterized protein YqiB (DUF1249 family)